MPCIPVIVSGALAERSSGALMTCSMLFLDDVMSWWMLKWNSRPSPGPREVGWFFFDNSLKGFDNINMQSQRYEAVLSSNLSVLQNSIYSFLSELPVLLFYLDRMQHLAWFRQFSLFSQILWNSAYHCSLLRDVGWIEKCFIYLLSIFKITENRKNLIWIVVEQLIHDRYLFVLVAIISGTSVIKAAQTIGMSRYLHS